jgi:hypothetical protein
MSVFERFNQQRRSMPEGTFDPEFHMESVSSTELEGINADVDQLDPGRGGGVHDTTTERVRSQLQRIPLELMQRGGGAPTSERDMKYGKHRL